MLTTGRGRPSGKILALKGMVNSFFCKIWLFRQTGKTFITSSVLITRVMDEEPLPEGWEMCKTTDERTYFIDHNTRTTTFEDPRQGKSTGYVCLCFCKVFRKGVVEYSFWCRPKGAYGIPVAYERNFRWKLSQFRYLCQSNQVASHLKLVVGRETLFEESYQQVELF